MIEWKFRAFKHFLAGNVIHIHDGETTRFQMLEYSLLRPSVVSHAAVQVEVFSSYVGQDGRIQRNARQLSSSQGVTGDLQDTVRTAVLVICDSASGPVR